MLGVLSPLSDSNLRPVLGAGDVARGIGRLFARNDIWCLAEVPLKNGRRADLMGIDAKGLVVIVEIKVARADLLGDAKWPDYLDYCDRFYWGLSPALDRAPLESESFRPATCGVGAAGGGAAQDAGGASRADRDAAAYGDDRSAVHGARRAGITTPTLPCRRLAICGIAGLRCFPPIPLSRWRC
jgi:hypothetical protein